MLSGSIYMYNLWVATNPEIVMFTSAYVYIRNVSLLLGVSSRGTGRWDQRQRDTHIR